MEKLMPRTAKNSNAHIPVSCSLRQAKRILLVDDDVMVLGLFEAVLTEAGYSVVACSSGVAAIKHFRPHHRFDLLMTDFQMPLMNGITLANLLTGVSRHLRVLIVSGSLTDEIALWELWRKNWCFLAKPVGVPLLLKTIDQLCGLAPIQMAELSTMPGRPSLVEN